MQADSVRGRMAVLVAVVALLLAAPASADKGDAELQRKVEARLAKEGFDQKADIQVEVESGVVRLSGITLRYVDLREADRLARKDAKRVVNLLRVVPEQPYRGVRRAFLRPVFLDPGLRRGRAVRH